MRITQGTFSFLEDLTDEQIEAQIGYALRNGWAIIVERTEDPHPRNALWELCGPARFDLTPDEAHVALEDVRAARTPTSYVKVVCYDRSLGRQTTALSFIASRPEVERGFRLERAERGDRRVQYTLS